MDWTIIIVAIIGLLGGGGIASFLFYKQERQRRVSDTNKIDADANETNARANGIKTTTLISVVEQLRKGYDRLAIQICNLEARVAKLEEENESLSTTVESLKRLVRRLWEIIRDNNLANDPELIKEVLDVLSDNKKPTSTNEPPQTST